MATVAEVQRVFEKIQIELEKVQRQLMQPMSVCQCDINAQDHKGPCEFCNKEGELQHFLGKGLEVLDIEDPVVFDYEAAEYLKATQHIMRA